MSFSKADFADVSDPSAWDVIGPSLALTRDDIRGFYNAFAEDAYQVPVSTSPSPAGTLWLFGATVADVIAGGFTLDDFDTWFAAAETFNGGLDIPALVGEDSVLYLVEEQAFVDFRLTSWTAGVGGQSRGGGYSYVRADTSSIPAPGAAPVLAAAGVMASRRRR